MDENKNFWNKTFAEETVKDQLVVAAVAPIVGIAAMAALKLTLKVAKSAVDKFQKDRNTTTTTEN